MNNFINVHSGYSLGIVNNNCYYSNYFDITTGIDSINSCEVFRFLDYLSKNSRLYRYLYYKYNKTMNDIIIRAVNNKKYKDKLYKNRYIPIYIKYNGNCKYDC